SDWAAARSGWPAEPADISRFRRGCDRSAVVTTPKSQVIELGAHRRLGGVPQFLVDIGVDVFHHLTRGGVLAEFPQRRADLFETFLAVRQIHVADRGQIR